MFKTGPTQLSLGLIKKSPFILLYSTIKIGTALLPVNPLFCKDGDLNSSSVDFCSDENRSFFLSGGFCSGEHRAIFGEDGDTSWLIGSLLGKDGAPS